MIVVEVLARTIQGLLLQPASIWPCQIHLGLMRAGLSNVTVSGWGPEWCNNRCAIASITSLPLWVPMRLFNSRQRTFTAVGLHECGTGHHNRTERQFVGGQIRNILRLALGSWTVFRGCQPLLQGTSSRRPRNGSK